MKLRIKGNSIRLRLTQSEVEQVGQGQAVQEFVSFGPQTPRFLYTLATSDLDQVSARYQEHELKVIIPKKEAKQWAATDQVGIEENLELEGGATLYVLIEKDFQCLHKRSTEDESDHFPNPADIKK